MSGDKKTSLANESSRICRSAGADRRRHGRLLAFHARRILCAWRAPADALARVISCLRAFGRDSQADAFSSSHPERQKIVLMRAKHDEIAGEAVVANDLCRPLSLGPSIGRSSNSHLYLLRISFEQSQKLRHNILSSPAPFAPTIRLLDC